MRNINKAIFIAVIFIGMLSHSATAIIGGPTPPTLKLNKTALTLQGQMGMTYNIESSPHIGLKAPWQTLTNLTLSGSIGVWPSNFPTNRNQFYRAVVVPALDGVTPINITALEGGTLTTSDGAVLYLPPRSGTNDWKVTFIKTKNASGIITNKLQSISAEYDIQITTTISNNPSGKVYISMPLDQEFIPLVTNLNQLKSRLVPEYYDAFNHTWQQAGFICAYDFTNHLVTFDIDLKHFSQLTNTTQNKSLSKIKPNSLNPLDWECIFGVSIRQRYRAKTATGIVHAPPFVFHYYEPDPTDASSVIENSARTRWSSGQLDDHFKEFMPPTYIADLHDCLRRSLKGFLLIPDGQNGYLFGDEPESEIPIYVDNIGSYDGASPTGGPILLSNSRLTTWEIMRTTAAHELVHYLQGYKYSNYESSNRWFMEATAQYYTSLVAGYDPADPTTTQPLSEAERLFNYAGTANNCVANYLSVPIFTSDDNSHYAMGHFLGYLESRYPNIIASVLNQRGRWLVSSGKDLDYLSSSLKNLKVEGDNPVGTILNDYLLDLVTLKSPSQAERNFATAVVDAISVFTGKSLTMPGKTTLNMLTSPLFSDTLPYKSLATGLGPLSALKVELHCGRLSRDSMLVVSQPWNGTLFSYSYAYGHKKSPPTPADYLGKPLDTGKAFPYSTPLAIPNFGTNTGNIVLFEQVIINKSEKQRTVVVIEYYILERPLVTAVSDSNTIGEGEVTWSSEGISTAGGMPSNIIDGWDVYLPDQTKLNDERIGLPLAGVTKMSFSSSKIKPSKMTKNDITVVIYDKYGNSWPQNWFKPETISVKIEGPNITLVDMPIKLEAKSQYSNLMEVLWLPTTTMDQKGNFNASQIGTNYVGIAYPESPKNTLDILEIRVLPKFIITPLSANLKASETVDFSLDTSNYLTSEDKIIWTLEGIGTLVNNHYVAPKNTGTAIIKATLAANTNVTTTATINITDLVKVQTYYSKISPLLCIDDFQAFPTLLDKLCTHTDPVSQAIWTRIPEYIQQIMTNTQTSTTQLKTIVCVQLNSIVSYINDGSFYNTERFAGILLSPETLTLIAQNPQEYELIRLHRMLLEDAYPKEIAKNNTQPQISAEYTKSSVTGSKEGLYRSWYESGQRSREAQYSNGTIITSTRWFENGLLKETMEGNNTSTHTVSYWGYDNGNSVKNEETVVDSNGFTTHWISYNSNGNVKIDATYSKSDGGIVSGHTIYYYYTGDKEIEEDYVAYKRSGPSTSWYQNGQKREAGNYSLDKREGPWTYWHDNGNKSAEGVYTKGLKQGVWTTYYYTGEKMWEGSYKDDQEIGVWNHWTPDGTLYP